MPYTRDNLVSASDSTGTSEELKLERHLQRQLEEDVARIFDESIYTDFEVVYGKLKIPTHTCILKARTNKFYHTLNEVLSANFGRDTFDEIYSFISDAYTECNIKKQEREIIRYLQNNLQIFRFDPPEKSKTKEEKIEADVFLTPKCISPLGEKKCDKTTILSPSTELTKEYYALVPIEGSLLEQELNEQDVLSNAFHSIIKTQDKSKFENSPRSKPTSLCLTSSHIPKTVKHSNSCDNIFKFNFGSTSQSDEKSTFVSRQGAQSNQVTESAKPAIRHIKNSVNCQSTPEKAAEPPYSPDSLIADEPSSSSDYLSAAYAGSSGLGSTSCLLQLNVEDTIKMDHLFTSSDSGLENTELLESVNVTLTDISLTDSTLHELTSDEHQLPKLSGSPNKQQLNQFKVSKSFSDTTSFSVTSSERSSYGQSHPQNKTKDVSNSSKKEKEKQNEEIVIMESSSVSSETGSWESVFPPKVPEKEMCEIFINTERQHSCSDNVTVTQTVPSDDNVTDTETACQRNQPESSNIVQSSPHKTSACFIDAANLVDIEDRIEVGVDEHITYAMLPEPSQPVQCFMVNKHDISPNDWSESNENDDSLEQAESKDQKFAKGDLSPTIFEMTLTTEDSLSTNSYEKPSQYVHVSQADAETKESLNYVSKSPFVASSSVLSPSTPFNSIMTVKNTTAKRYDAEEIENDPAVINRDDQAKFRVPRCNESIPIASSNVSMENGQVSNKSPVIGNNSRKSPKASTASAWVVDMSMSPKNNDKHLSNSNTASKKPTDKVCESLKYESKYDSIDTNNKSVGSVNSDSSEKSSHKFYIDLSSLPDPSPKNNETGSGTEKKNMFSMYIDLGEKSTVKGMPCRLSSSLNTKKQSNNDCKSTPRLPKVTKAPLSECIIPTFPKIFDPNDTFETYETLCDDPNISITDIIALSKDNKKKDKEKTKKDPGSDKLTKQSQSVNGDRAYFSPITQNTIQEENPNEKETDIFVKLSDLDRPVQKPDLPILCNDMKDRTDVRMTRSIPENNWGEESLAVSSKSIDVISSFHSENALSLNRLFPHLKNQFSKSMPGSLPGRTRSPLRQSVTSSPGEAEEQVSDISEVSSIQSSVCRSVVENSTSDTSQTSSLIGNCQSRLGRDLLRMFLEEIAPDVIVEVSGKRIKAHKCILSSRCQYFAGILSGGWVESAGNVINLPPFSFNVVHFVLCHIYSGVSTIPCSISILELATISDMLGLEGLKEVIMFTLKEKYCHHFHRPCHLCIAGVLECFPLSSVYGLDDLYRKCLRWITKYFAKVWPTKAFAVLPKELLDKCYQEHIINFTVENLIDTVYGCGIAVASLQNTRWAENVARLCRRLVNAAAHFAAPRLVAILRTVGNMSPDAPPGAKEALDDCMAAAIEWAPPDETCRSYAFLSNVVKETRSQLHSAHGANSKVTPQNNLLVLHAPGWRLQCEGALVRAGPRVVSTQAFKDLPPDLRKRLRELGCIMYGTPAMASTSPDRKTPYRKSKFPAAPKPNQANVASTGHSIDIEHVRTSFVPYKPKPLSQISAVDVTKVKSNSELRDIKKSTKATVPNIRTTKAQEERAKFNQSKTNQHQQRMLKHKVPARTNAFENTKPRYLEPRPCRDASKKPTKSSFRSSSDSSRNLSPVLTRSAKMGQAKEKSPAMSQDSLATSSRPRTAEPSTDSLSESQASNRYGTYTKTKHTSKGSIESIKSAKYQNLPHTPGLGAKVKSKIPVIPNQCSRSGSTDARDQREVCRSSTPRTRNVIVSSTPRAKYDRKQPGSLMSATKSSAAKIMPRVVKQPPPPIKPLQDKTENTKEEKPADLSTLGRSGTFLKDEPMFGDKSTDIDSKP